MSHPVRTRFAPSPTGSLHLGNVRTAILNWLFARHCGGAFILRLEDTDTARNVEGGEEAIRAALDWLGLDRDEGPVTGGPHGPYRQSEREPEHAARARDLLAAGAAFRCFCTPDEIEARRAAAIEAGQSPGRDTACRALDPADAARRAASGEPAAIRLRVESGPVAFEDRLKGTLHIDGDDLGDMVLVRPDGRPTYNFAVAVDDLDMRISHVIRGVSHLSNTPKQVLLYRALGVEPPEFVHIPQVLAPGGETLSKRRGAVGILEYRDRGFHPDAILNYASLLSWSSPSGEEYFTREDLIREIDLDRIGATDAEMDEAKMAWLSGRHLRAEPPARLAMRLAEAGVDDIAPEALARAAEVLPKRIELLTELADEVRTLFAEPRLDDPEAARALTEATAGPALDAARRAWASVEWRVAALKPALQVAAEATGLRGRPLFQPIRVALTGRLHGPDLADAAYALGRDRVLARVDRARERAAGPHTTEEA